MILEFVLNSSFCTLVMCVFINVAEMDVLMEKHPGRLLLKAFICLKLFFAISDTSDEQNSQSSMENSMNSSEKAEIQSSGENDLITEASKNSQVTLSAVV